MPRDPWERIALWALAGAAGALLAVFLFSPRTYDIGPLQVTMAVRAAGGGETRLVVPPLGAVRARTHRTPVGLELRLRAVDVRALEAFAAVTPSENRALARLRVQLARALRHFSGRLAVLTLVGAAVAALLLPARDRRRGMLVALAVAVCAVSILGAATAATYDVRAFRQPRFSGALKAAPWMIGLAQQALVEADRLGERLAAIAANLTDVFARIEQVQPLGAAPGERSLLVVSDIHNNPAAIDFIRAMVRAFRPQVVLDAGDLTDWGTPFEARLLDDLARIGVPYLLVPGNHESPGLIAQLQELQNVRVLRLGERRVGDLRVVGVADPAASQDSPRVGSEQTLKAVGADLAGFVDGLPVPPDVIVAHNPVVAAAVAGQAPLLVSGHTHRTEIRQLGATVWINPGTTGAAGLRGLEQGADVRYSLMLVHLTRRDGRWHPLAVDRVRVSNFHTGFSIERRAFEPPRSPVAPPER